MSNLNPESAERDPEKVLRELELELAQKRIARTQASNRRGNLRALSFGLLFVIIVGAFFGFYLLLNSDALQERRAQASARNHVSPSPAESPRP